MIMANTTDSGTGKGGSSSSPSSPSRPKLTLVTPANFDPNPPASLPLIPTSDLASLLSDHDLRKKYRAGRYIPGKNTGLKIYWTSPLSATSTHIAHNSSPKSGTDVIVSLAAHIGTMDMMGWESVLSLKSTHDTYASSINSLAPVTISLFDSLSGIKYEVSGGRRVVVIPDFLDEDLGRLAGTTGISKGILCTLAVANTFLQQPKHNVNHRLVSTIEYQVLALQCWLRWKAKALKAAIDEFEEYDRARISHNAEESFQDEDEYV